jgi:hypothetical protein
MAPRAAPSFREIQPRWPSRWAASDASKTSREIAVFHPRQVFLRRPYLAQTAPSGGTRELAPQNRSQGPSTAPAAETHGSAGTTARMSADLPGGTHGELGSTPPRHRGFRPPHQRQPLTRYPLHPSHTLTTPIASSPAPPTPTRTSTSPPRSASLPLPPSAHSGTARRTSSGGSSCG